MMPPHRRMPPHRMMRPRTQRSRPNPTCFFAECTTVNRQRRDTGVESPDRHTPNTVNRTGSLRPLMKMKSTETKRNGCTHACSHSPYDSVMTVPALPESASTALSSEVMIARRPALEAANFMAA